MERKDKTKEKKDMRTQKIVCDIDTIIAKKIKKLNGYGVQQAITTLEKLYQLKNVNATGIEIFDEMVRIARIMREYTSKTKGEQQKLLGL